MGENDFINDNAATIQHIKKIPGLESFKGEDLEQFLKFSEIKTYTDNEIIIEENSRDDRVFYLISGKVKVMKSGKELVVLRRIGDVFGEIGVVTGIARSASVYALGHTTCLAIHVSQIDNLNEDNRLTFKYLIFRGFAEILANRLKKTTDELIETQKQLAKIK